MRLVGGGAAKALILFAAVLLTVLLVGARSQSYDGRAVDEVHGRQIAVVDQKLEDLDKRVTGIEQAKIPERLADIQGTVNYDHAILIAVGIGILGILIDRAFQVKKEGKRNG